MIVLTRNMGIFGSDNNEAKENTYAMVVSFTGKAVSKVYKNAQDTMRQVRIRPAFFNTAKSIN